MEKGSEKDADFIGKKVIVTGAGKGIGRAISITVSKLGATVHAISRTQSDLDSLKQEDPSIETHCLDLLNWDETRSALKGIGTVDMLVNNAGVYYITPVFEVTEEEIDKTFDTNVKSVFNVTQVVSKLMVENGIEGSIVNVSSNGSFRAYRDECIYSCSKAALDMMTMSFALELGKYKIRVNSVNPTLVMTQMGRKYVEHEPKAAEKLLNATPLGRFAELEDVVNVVVFLLSSKSAMMTGTSLPIDGGNAVQTVS